MKKIFAKYKNKLLILIFCSLSFSSCSFSTSEANVPGIESTESIHITNSELSDIKFTENNSLTEIDSELQGELISVIECYHHLKDLIGGRYSYAVDENIPQRNLSYEYNPENNYYDECVKYYSIKTSDDFYNIYKDYFFRSNSTYIFSSEEMSIKDYWEITNTYLSLELTQEILNEYFMDRIDESGYIIPAKYWYNNGKLLQHCQSEYLYGGINDYNNIEFVRDENDMIYVTVVRKYGESESYIEYSFVNENDAWKIREICYLD